MTTGWLVARILALALLAGCATARIPPVTDPARAVRPAPHVGADTLRDDGDLATLAAALRQSLAWLGDVPPDRAWVVGPRTVTAAEQARGLHRLLDLLSAAPSADELATRVLAEFEILASVGAPRGATGDPMDGAMLVTGYYEPTVEAAERPSPTHAVPIYGPPDDLVEVRLEAFDPRFRGERVMGRLDGRRLVPYWPRAEIDAGRLAGRGLELAWARDPVDVFFMEIQGSGSLRFADGREIRVGYAASNGRPYRAIGRLLIDEGRIPREAMSMQAIRAWLREHPEARTRVLEYNESYVFFRRLDGPPVGSLGVPLTPGRSIATDPRLFPPGALAFIRSTRPVRAVDGAIRWVPLSRFVLNQDTGGAIRGAGRVDVFWGRGSEAELAAGLMKEPGTLYFLVPRPAR